MAITIKNNTTKLQNLKNRVNALPDKEEGGTVVLDQTTVSPADVLAYKTFYYADTDGQPVKSTGEMNNWGDKIDVKVGLDGTGQDTRHGYITGVSASFAEEVNNEINTQADLIAQIKSVLNNKMAGGGGSSDETLKGLIDRSLTKIVIPEGITEIGEYALSGMLFLTSIEIPNSVIFINCNAFERCKSITNIEIPNNVRTIRDFAFYDCSSLESIEIPDSVGILGGFVFQYCTNLMTAIIGNGVDSIEASVFENCSKLTNVTIGNGVGRIGVNAFLKCSKLTYLTIPANVKKLESGSLSIGSSTNKATIRFESTTPPTISTSTFNTSYLEKIEVPASAVETYKTATNWSKFADYIVDY